MNKTRNYSPEEKRIRHVKPTGYAEKSANKYRRFTDVANQDDFEEDDLVEVEEVE